MLWALVTWHKCLQSTIYFSFQFSFNKWSEVYNDNPAWCHINRLICIKYIMEINGIFRTTTQSNLYYEHNNYFGVLNVPEHTHNIWNTFKTSEHVLNTCISFALWKNKKKSTPAGKTHSFLPLSAKALYVKGHAQTGGKMSSCTRFVDYRQFPAVTAGNMISAAVHHGASLRVFFFFF